MKKLKTIAKSIFYLIILWGVISSYIQRFKCENLTETQLFKRIPNSFVCDWVECDKK